MQTRNIPVFGRLVDTFNAYGFTRRIVPTDNPGLRRLTAPGLVGVEDISIDQEHGIGYLSAAERRTHLAGGAEDGGLHRLDLTDPDRQPERISDPDEGIYPHGIAIWAAPDGHRELYAIDHAANKHSVRRYRIDGNRLQLLRVYADPLIHAPNDLTVAGNGQCYVTNDHGFRRPWARAVEECAGLAGSSVGARWRNRLLIGSVFEPFIIDVSVPEATTAQPPGDAR